MEDRISTKMTDKFMYTVHCNLIHACSKYHHLLFNSLFVLGIFRCQLKAYLVTSLEPLLLNCWSLQNMPYWTNLRVTGASDTMLFIVFFLHQVMFLHIKGWLMIWASSLNWWTSLSLIDKGNSLQRVTRWKRQGQLFIMFISSV